MTFKMTLKLFTIEGGIHARVWLSLLGELILAWNLLLKSIIWCPLLTSWSL